ncbi:MAG TPA: PBP1A family penicillin-binding protein [Gemmatimonadaceae bacterium]|nr:PBP1A family penicillin-binding protein [Gemmatimonadaceae bacterium]
MRFAPRAFFRDFARRLRAEPGVAPRDWMRPRWKSLTVLTLAVASVVAFDVWVVTCGFQGCPTQVEIRTFRPAEGGRILDRDGRLLGRITQVRRVNVPLSKVPAHVRQAFIAVEDRRFYQHNGLDWRGFARAVVRNVTSLGVREGFSTITMQTVRNTFAARYAGERTLRRKMMELRVSRLLEQSLTKDQILELYLNVIYLGNGMYGVEAASRDLFGKSVDKLTLPEAATLAALPKGPSRYTPRKDARRATQRRNLVLAVMAREGYLPRDRAAAAARQPMRVSATEWRPTNPDDSYALDLVRSLVDSVLQARGVEEADARVYTTLDGSAQRAATRAVRRYAAAIQRESDQWYGRAGPAAEGAMVAVDPRTGDVRALVGGRSYERGGFNRAVSARRQPGSAFKPFVYAAALAVGYTPASMVDDEPVEVEQGGNVWAPSNFGDEYRGRVTLRDALVHSSNAATVRVSRAVGEPRVIAVAQRNGISTPLTPVPAIALGAEEVTPWELVLAYAPFANGGYRVTPRLVRRIESADGTVLWSSEIGARVPVMDPRDVYQLTSMLRSVVDHGTGRTVRDMGVQGPVAGKTGTTNNGADVWFVGYTPAVVAGFWFGYDTPRAISGNAAGGRLAAPAWAEFFSTGWRERSSEGEWAPPAGMVMRLIDAETGELATDFCPVTQREWFKPGTEPTSPCRAHENGGEDPFGEPNEAWADQVKEKVGRALKKVFRF